MSSWRAAQEPGFFGYPDDDPWCARHDQEADTCTVCIAEVEEEKRQLEESQDAAEEPIYVARVLDELEDLPY